MENRLVPRSAHQTEPVMASNSVLQTVLQTVYRTERPKEPLSDPQTEFETVHHLVHQTEIVTDDQLVRTRELHLVRRLAFQWDPGLARESDLVLKANW